MPINRERRIIERACARYSRGLRRVTNPPPARNLDPLTRRRLDRGMKPILLSLFVVLLMVGCNGMPGAYKHKPPVEEQAKDLSP